jgi:DNA-binding MarR family transcriptional regulator
VQGKRRIAAEGGLIMKGRQALTREQLFSFDDYDNVIGFLVSQTADLLARRLTAIIDRNGISITPREFVIINRLHQFDSLSQVQLANLSYKDPPATSRLVESLRKKGMVTRRNSVEDRRVTHVSLTDRGRAVRAIIAPQLADMLQAAVAGVSDADLLATHRVMKAILAAGDLPDGDSAGTAT